LRAAVAARGPAYGNFTNEYRGFFGETVSTTQAEGLVSHQFMKRFLALAIVALAVAASAAFADGEGGALGKGPAN
jgi:hypothetical protein